MSLSLFCKIGIVRLAHDCVDVAGCLRTVELMGWSLGTRKERRNGRRPGKTGDFLPVPGADWSFEMGKLENWESTALKTIGRSWPAGSLEMACRPRQN